MHDRKTKKIIQITLKFTHFCSWIEDASPCYCYVTAIIRTCEHNWKARWLLLKVSLLITTVHHTFSIQSCPLTEIPLYVSFFLVFDALFCHCNVFFPLLESDPSNRHRECIELISILIRVHVELHLSRCKRTKRTAWEIIYTWWLTRKVHSLAYIRGR